MRRPAASTTRCLKSFASLAAFSLSLHGVALAAWPHSPGLNLPICTAANEQFRQVMCSDGAGGAIIAWEDLRNGATYDIYAQHVLPTGSVDPAWPANGRVICTATNNQQVPAIASDGAGGAIIAWVDLRGGSTYDIYAQRVQASGVVDPAWPVDGRALCTAALSQMYPVMASDGAGGAIVSWQDFRGGSFFDIYAQRVLSTGAVDPAWPVDGRALCLAGNSQTFPMMCSDGVGGAFVTWNDTRFMINDIYAQRVLASGAVDPAWPADGRAVCAATNAQNNPVIDADGTGGAYVTWQDFRSGSSNDVYAHHLLSGGIVDPAWPADGRAVSAAASSQISPAIVADGRGGAIITWQDNRTAGIYDIYAHHVTAAGVDPAWPADGRAVCSATQDQVTPQLVSDGAGGAIITWADGRTGASGMYAHHVLAAGTVDSQWPTDGRALSTASYYEIGQRMVSDGAGGAIVAWTDGRSGANDIYAQRVARFGYLGTPEAVIAGVTDVPNDDGGKVKVSWDASWLDTESDPSLNFYEVWRSVPASLAEAAIRAGAHRLSGFGERPVAGARSFVVMPDAAQAYYWEYLAAQNAVHYIPNYAYLAATTGDSTGPYNPKTAFMVVARNTSGSMYWLSIPASGYSVDNLAPIAPAPFTGQYGGGITHLHWNPNAESDLAGYRLYRGASIGFVPGPGNLVAALDDTGYVDLDGGGYFYRLSAVDIHGNESPYASLLPAGTVDVIDSALPRVFSLARPGPNPAAGPVTLRWSLPRESRASLAIYDAGGRRVRVIEQGVMPAGDHTSTWDLRDDRGAAVASGLYFLKLDAEGRVLVRRLATLK